MSSDSGSGAVNTDRDWPLHGRPTTMLKTTTCTRNWWWAVSRKF